MDQPQPQPGVPTVHLLEGGCDGCGVQSPKPIRLIVKGVPVRGTMRQTLRYTVCSLWCGAKVLERRSDGHQTAGTG